MRHNVSRRVIASTEEFLDASPIGGILPILVRPGAVHAELIRAHLGPLVADAVYCSLALALRGETVADRVWLVAPMNRTGSGQLNGEPLTPGNLLAFGGSAEVAGASEAPLKCGILSIAPSALERIATALGVKSHPPGEGEFRVASVVDRGRLSRAFDLLSHTVNRHEGAALTKREAGVIERAFLEIAVRSLAGDSSRGSPYQSARLTSARIVRTCEDYARKWRYQNVTLADLCEASGVSERRVRSAFYECYQMSPTAYLRVAALNAVRRELIEGPRPRNAVSHAASDWGFWHLSRFAAQYQALFGESIAVGTALAGGPPHRSQRALLAHWAPTLGTGVESDVRPGMRDAGGREPPCFESAHPLPGHPVALAAAPQRPAPVPRDLFSECRHGMDVAGNRVVRDVPAHHAAQPLSLLRDGPVTALHEQGVHLAQLGRHSLRDRLAPQREPSRPGLPAHVREAEE